MEPDPDKINVYIAGPMRGYEDLNKKAFYAAEDKLRERMIYCTHNPSRWDDELGLTEQDLIENPQDYLQNAIRRDLMAIADCDAIYMLKGWEKSTGARLEHQLATFLSLMILYE